MKLLIVFLLMIGNCFADEVVAIRYGKLPKGLPDWFVKLDTDKDGQIGLYEWLAAKKPTKEFLEMDLNGDGLLTAEEYLRWKKKN